MRLLLLCAAILATLQICSSFKIRFDQQVRLRREASDEGASVDDGTAEGDGSGTGADGDSGTASAGESSGDASAETSGESSGDAPADTSGESSGDASADTSGESSGDASAETSGESSGDAPADTSGESSGDASADTSGESSGDASAETSGESSGDASAETSGESSGDASAESSGESSGDASAETSGESSGDASAETSGESSGDASADTSEESSGDASAESSGESSGDASAETSGESSGDASADTSGESSKDASAETSGESSGDVSAESTGESSGDASADTSGESSGDAAPDTSGESSGDAAPDTSGESSGDASPDTSGESSGDASPDTSGESSGDASPDTSGESSGDASAESTGESSGDASADTSEESSGDASAETTGESNGEASAETSGDSQTDDGTGRRRRRDAGSSDGDGGATAGEAVAATETETEEQTGTKDSGSSTGETSNSDAADSGDESSGEASATANADASSEGTSTGEETGNNGEGDGGDDGEDDGTVAKGEAEQVEAAQGEGANGDGSGLEEEGGEETSVNDNGVVAEKSSNTEQEEDTSVEEGRIQEAEFEEEENGESAEEIINDNGDDDDDDDNEDGDDSSEDGSSDTSSEGGSSDTPSEGGSSDTSSEGESSDTPSENGSSDTSSEGESSDTPSEGESSDTSSEGESSDTSSEGGSADTPSDQAEGAKRRRKRLAMKNPNYRWPKGIIPYSFDKNLGDKTKEALAAIRFVERHTCLRFVPYNDGKANKDHALGHPGHMIFTNKGYCASYVGLKRSKRGQAVSCTNRFVFIHEIGHAVFLVHEQNGENRKGIIRINYDNIRDDRLNQYTEIRESETMNSTGYDVSSIVHYPLGINSKNGKQTMTVLNEAPEMHVSGYMYYMAAEINKGYGCEAMKCPDMAVKCVKDSYPVIKGDKCVCQCTSGVDASTGCDKPKQSPVGVSDWGSGKIALLKPKDGCPAGMTESSIEHEGDGTGKKSGVFHLAATIARKSTLPLCVSDGGAGTWPMGRYCLFKTDHECPKNFEYGKYTIGNNDGSTMDLEFCCRDDGFPFEEVQMKSDVPFVLLKRHNQCQVIEDMYVYKEFFILDSSLKIKKEGTVPDSRVWGSRNTLQMFFCYYVPLTYGCGGTIDLTRDQPTGSFKTPNYPSNYPASTMCTWIISASEPESVIVLDFDDDTFCLEKGDHVDVHHNKIGQPSLRSTGKGYKPSVITLNNLLKVQFRSDLDTECSGFKATVRMVRKDEQAYNIDDQGVSYRGTIDFTHNKIPCLPWTEVTACPHHPFGTGDGGDGLDKNYCRNPGNGLAPWCYVSKDNCERNYCDVSMIGRPADNYPDCDKILEAHPNFCDDHTQAVRGCFKTCLDKLKVDKTPKKVSEVSCGKPDDISDGELVDGKDTYKVGEKALFRCTSGDGELERLCTTNGEWTAGGYVCGNCPGGWTAFDNYCYLYVDEPMAYRDAVKTCKGHSAKVASVRSQAESDMLATIARETAPQWLGMYRKKNSWFWDDDKSGVSGFTNWNDGEPHKKKKKKNAYIMGNHMKMRWRAMKARKKRPKFSFTCKRKNTGTRPCADQLSNCEATLKAFPEACKNYSSNEWAVQQCRKTCGACGDVSCSIPAAGANAILKTTGTSVVGGDVVYYECEEGYTVSEGALMLACLSSGQLTSAAPVCVAKSSVTRDSNDIDIRPRGRTLGSHYTYSGSADQYVIDAAGKIKAWTFFLQSDGTTVFQVWRPTEDATSMTFVGQNEVTAQNYRPHTYNVPDGEQITVEAGDRIGIWNPSDRAGIPFDTYGPLGDGGLRLVDKQTSKDAFVEDNAYAFKADSPRKIISFKAVVGPAE